MSKVKERTVTGLTKRGPTKGVPVVVIDSEAIELVERRYKAMQLRRNGYTVMDIAGILGVDSSTISRDIKEALAITLKEHALNTEEERQLQIERLDNILRAVTPLATEDIYEKRVDGRTGKEFIVASKPDPAYANIILQCETRRSKLLALDTPEVKKLEVTAIREYRGINVDDV